MTSSFSSTPERAVSAMLVAAEPWPLPGSDIATTPSAVRSPVQLAENLALVRYVMEGVADQHAIARPVLQGQNMSVVRQESGLERPVRP